MGYDVWMQYTLHGKQWDYDKVAQDTIERIIGTYNRWSLFAKDIE